MKKYVFALAAALFVGVAACYAQDYQRNGKEYTVVKKSSGKSEGVDTGFTWKIGDKSYKIYKTKNGSCYINRISSKTGKEYRSYLPKKVSEEISNEINKKR